MLIGNQNCQKTMYFLSFVIYFSILLPMISTTKLEASLDDITKQVFSDGEENLGYFAAYSDMNNNKMTDVFVISENGKEVYLMMGSKTSPYLLRTKDQTINISDNKIASSAFGGDFNGDGEMDAMITVHTGDPKDIEILIYFGANDELDTSKPYTFPDHISDEPLVLDANGDLIPDLFVTYLNGTRIFLIGQTKGGDFSLSPHNFATASERQTFNKVRFPHSNAFVATKTDDNTNLFITSIDSNDKLVLEFWEGSSFGLELRESILTDSDPNFGQEDQVVGMATFSNIRGSKKQDLVIPICQNKNRKWCSNSTILAHIDGLWLPIFSGGDKWAFKLPNEKTSPADHITLRFGDFDLDSYPDIIVVMHDLTSDPPAPRAILLYNRPCSQATCKAYGREFLVERIVPTKGEPIMASFFDFLADGTLDILVVAKETGKLTMEAFQNVVENDVTFLMVQVISTVDAVDIYGSNIPGPLISYSTTNPQGGPQYGSCSQMMQSSHLALNIPHCVFGLGRLANFVDKLTVSVPRTLLSGNGSDFLPMNHTWTMLIPNSQMYVIPFPVDEPAKWRNKLLVTPSRNVIMTGVVLLGTLAIVALSIASLHCIEKREDKQEKIEEAYRFHFDAM